MLKPDVKRALKSKAHALKPIILLGHQGLTPAVFSEIELALNHHELIKIKLPQVERDARLALVQEILGVTHADLVQSMGRIVTIYKENQDELPAASAQKASKNHSASRSRSRD